LAKAAHTYSRQPSLIINKAWWREKERIKNKNKKKRKEKKKKRKKEKKNWISQRKEPQSGTHPSNLSKTNFLTMKNLKLVYL